MKHDGRTLAQHPQGPMSKLYSTKPNKQGLGMVEQAFNSST